MRWLVSVIRGAGTSIFPQMHSTEAVNACSASRTFSEAPFSFAPCKPSFRGASELRRARVASATVTAAAQLPCSKALSAKLTAEAPKSHGG
jgi:hypothetical protein